MKRAALVVLVALVALAGLFLAKESGTCLPPSPRGNWPATGEVKHLRANGIDFAYVEAGSGPLVLLLHGYPETPAVWATILPALAQAGYHAVAPWMRGYPPSGAAPDGDYSIRALSEDAVALISALGYQRADLIGHDWGATAVYLTAIRAPQSVGKLVAVSIPHPIALIGDPTALWKASHFIAYQTPGLAWWLNTKDLCHVDSIYQRWAPGFTPPQAVLDSVKESLRTDGGLRGALGYYWSFFKSATNGPADLTIRAPTLVIAGVNDGAVDFFRYTTARRGFAGPYQFIAFEKSGHFPEIEEPEHFNQAVLAFLGPPNPQPGQQNQ
jgi:pimeloyl-ACP methyl ester carboxylesterase